MGTNMDTTSETTYDCHWPDGRTAATVMADPACTVVLHVEGPTLYDRESAFDCGLASVDRTPTCFGRSSSAFARYRSGRFTSRAARTLLSLAALTVCAVVLAGCGGGAAVEPPATDAAGADPAAVVDPNAPVIDPALDPALDPATTGDPGALVGNGDAGSDVADNEGIATSSAAPGTQVATSDSTPKAFVKALGKKPIVVIIHQPGAIVDEHLLAESRIASRAAKGVVFLSYIAGDFKHYGDLPGKIGLLSSPSVAVISRDGSIENFWSGYVDNILIAKSVMLAAAAKGASVTPDDAPPVQTNPLDAAASGAGAGSAVTTGTS